MNNNVVMGIKLGKKAKLSQLFKAKLSQHFKAKLSQHFK
jgi:hypothetical protein